MSEPCSLYRKYPTMNVLIVHAHPEPKSFNGALTATARRFLSAGGHHVVVSDLYSMKWRAESSRENFTTVADPVYYKQQFEEHFAVDNDGFAPDVEAEVQKLFACDLLIFQFPLWWFSMPAILKGWVDRVFVRGKVYGDGRMLSTGMLAGRRALISLTTGGPQNLYSPDGIGDLEQTLFHINFGVLRFVGFDVLSPVISWAPAHIGEEGRLALLDQYERRLAGIQTDVPLQFPTKLGLG